MNFSSGYHNVSRSGGKHDETSMLEMQSSSFSGFQQLHNLYCDVNDLPGNENSKLSSAGYKRKKMHNRVKDTYYKILRKRFGRQSVFNSQDPPEFDDQIQIVNDNVRIPNNERIFNLRLEDKTSLERLQTYRDTFPFLRLRKKVFIFAK